MERVEKIAQEALNELGSLQRKNAEAYQKMAQLTSAAEKAVQEAKVAELEFKLSGQEFQSLIKQLFIINKLDSTCKIDLNTGIVSWPSETPVEIKQEVVEPVVDAKKVKKAKTSKKGK